MSVCRASAWIATGLVAVLLALPAQGAARAPDDVPDALVDTLSAMTFEPAASSRSETARSWLEAMLPRLDPFLSDADTRRALLERVRLEAALAGLAPDLVLAVIQVESAFDADARSSAGAQGLMQIMPFWKNVIGRPRDDLFDAGLNLRYGCTILAYYLRLENGDLTRALARYNGSLGQTWYPERVMRAWTERWWHPPSA